MYRKSLSFSVKEISCFDSNCVVGIQLTDSSGNSWYIFGVYLPSDNNIEAYVQELNIFDNLYHYCSNYGNTVIAGDFNGSILDRRNTNTRKSDLLRSFVSQHNLSIQNNDFSVEGNTYTFIQKQTTLDYILFDKYLIYGLQSYKIIEEGSISITSDHLPIVAKFDFKISRHSLKNSSSKHPAWHKANPESLAQYRHRTNNTLRSIATTYHLQSECELDEYICNISDTLCKGAAATIPFTSFNPFTRPEWTKTVKNLHAEERAKRRIWLSEGRPRGMNFTSYREYKRAKRLFRTALDQEHDNYMRNVYNDIDHAAEFDIRLFWKLTKRRKPRSSRVYPEIRDIDGVKYSNPDGVAEVFSKFYETLYSPSESDNFDDIFRNEIDSSIGNIIKRCENDSQNLPGGKITTSELRDVINSLKLRKAPGADSIANEHVIHSGEALIQCLTNVFNAIVRFGKVPEYWKRGLIVPLFKGGGKPKDECKSYRPVALLPCFFKIFEKILLSRTKQILLDCKRFPNSQQQGFQKNLGCLTASFNLQETIFHNLEYGNNVYVSFFRYQQCIRHCVEKLLNV